MASRKRVTSLIAAVFLAFGALLSPGAALANLTILDPIITFAEGERTKAIRIVNAGAAPLQVRVSVVNLRRMPDGTFAEVTDPQPGEKFADRMVRFSPSQFTLAPGAQQAIRLAVQMPADTAPGQYSTFLRVAEVGIGETGTSTGVQIGLGFMHQLPITITRR